MNLLFLSTWYPFPADNGSKLRVWYLLKALACHHRVTVLSFAFDTADTVSNALQDWCERVETVTLNPYEVNRTGALRTFSSMRPVASRPIAAMGDLVQRVTTEQPYDIIIASTQMMVDYALAVLGGVKVLEEHNSMTRWAWERAQRQPGVLGKVRGLLSYAKARRYDVQTMRRFALNVMVSEQDRAVYNDALPAEKLAVVPNGVDSDHNQPGLAVPVPGRLVYNGSLTYSANYDAMRHFLANIWPGIRAARPDVSLHITGSTKGVDLADLALDDGVTLTGYVDDVRLPVAQAEVCVVPLRDGGGTRLKILEAMALGTPVIATSKGAEGLDAVDGEHLLIADVPDDFAAATLALMNNREQRTTLARNARRLVEERYDWEQIGARFVELVEATVARHKNA